MNVTKKNIDDVYKMTDSKYELVAAVAKKARSLADEAEKEGLILYEKPVNIVLGNLIDGKSVIVKPDKSAKIYEEENFEVSVSASEEE